MSVLHIGKENFEELVLKSEKKVLLDFWATWCGPCKMLAPILEEFAKDNEGKIKVCKVDVDDEPMLAAKFGIASIPTLILFKDGAIANTSLGYITRAQLDSFAL